MTTSGLVKQLCKEKHISLSELARRLGQSRQNFYKKLNRETLTLEDLMQIADVLDVKFKQSFILSDGTEISTDIKE